jgi:hypothetical protein
MVDVDGVLSLFGPRAAAVGGLAGLGAANGDGAEVEGSLHSIEGIPHFLSATAARHLLELAPAFEFVWASGWEEKADEYLPHLLGLPAGMPFVRFPRRLASRSTNAHWKLEAIATYAGERPLAWVDDAFNPGCHAWAAAREAPTLLVATEPERGLTAREAGVLMRWAHQLQG